jgi:hypothetical protein
LDVRCHHEVGLVDAAGGRRSQPDDVSAARPLARQDAERDVLTAAELREATRTMRGAAMARLDWHRISDA